MDRSTYEIRLAQWTKIVEECSRRPSGMTVTAWAEEHGIGVKSYYYWQRKVRRAMAQLMRLLATGKISIYTPRVIIPK